MSPRYENHLDAWLNGQLDSLRFPRNAAELGRAHTLARLTLLPAPEAGAGGS